MNMISQCLSTSRDPLQAVLDAPGGAVLAIIAGVEGPSYRPVGAAMAVLSENERIGTLSSGCIEHDISLHALQTREDGKPKSLRYGLGSPFVDIQLPCGGGLDVLLLPNPDHDAIREVIAHRANRTACTLEIDCNTGAMRVMKSGATGMTGSVLRVRYEPEIRFLTFGKGPEASTFSALVQTLGYPNLLLSPDDETLEPARQIGCDTRHMVSKIFPKDLNVDDRTAIVLFFHDHEWEPEILCDALDTNAFYIGAQGSARARDARLMALEAMGVSEEARARLHGPIGLIPSTREARMLSVSVLAEVLASATVPAK